MSDTGTSGFLTSTLLSLLVFLFCFLLFSFIRNKFRDVYQFRRLIHQWKSYDDYDGNRVGVPEKAPRSKPFHWVTAAMSMTEEDIVEKIGLEQAMYLRYVRSMLISFGISSILSLFVLMPVYGTGNYNGKMENSGEDNPSVVSGLRTITLSNVVQKDPRMWATGIVESVSCLVFLYFFFRDYKKFAEYRRKDLVSENPKNYTLAVYDIPAGENNEEDVKRRFESIIPGQISRVIIPKDSTKLSKLGNNLEKAISSREKAEWLSANKLGGERPEERVGCCGMLRCWDKKVDTIDYWTNEQDKLGNDIIEEYSKARSTPSAIILFKNKRAASILSQANMANDSTEWNVETMPEPKGLNWNAFSIPYYQATIRRISVFSFIVALTFFWSIPAFGIASLISLDRAAEKFAFLRPVLNWNRELKGLIQGLLPTLILAIIVALIPIVIRFFVSKERLHSTHVIERKTRDYFYFFTIYSSFFCIVIGASILDEIKAIASNFDFIKMLDLLGKSIPASSLFFATFIVFQTGIVVSIDLLNPARLIFVTILKKMAKTERQKRAAQSYGCDPQLFRKYGSAMLVAFIGLMYNPMAPIMAVLCSFYFGYIFLVHRYNLCFNMHTESDGAGESYTGAFWGTLLALSLRCAVLTAVLGLKRSEVAGFCLIPLIITIAVGIYTGRRFRRVSKYGSLTDHFSEKEEIPDRYVELYDQPSSKPQDYKILSGVTEIDDYYEDSREIPGDS